VASLSVVEMAPEGLRPDLVAAIDEARETQRAAHRESVAFSSQDASHVVDIHVVPIKGPQQELFFLILFDPASAASVAESATGEHESSAEAGSSARGEIAHLQQEAQATRDYMRALVQDKDNALEELRAANEEIQSSNEELQSINEELETAKEELQSTNEELRTVNDMLASRNAELSRANDDLNNLLRAVDLPTIMVDREHRVRRFTPAATRVMNLLPVDVGRPLTDIASTLQIDDLAGVLREVIEETTTHERDVRGAEDHWYSLRVRPYQTEDNTIAGAVLTLVDIDQLRRSVRDLEQAARYNAALDAVLSVLKVDQPAGETLPLVLEAACEAVGAQAAAVFAREDDVWAMRYGHGLSSEQAGGRLSDDQMPQAKLAETTESIVAVHIVEDEETRRAREDQPLQSVIAVPLFHERLFFGVLTLEWFASAAELGTRQVDFAGKVGGLVSLALRQ
jgi:PAS domain-containing protein